MATVIPLYRPQEGLDVGGTPNLPPYSQAFAQALKGFGGAISGLGADLAAVAERKSAREKEKEVFGAEQSWLQFQNRMKEQYALRTQEMAADGTGWHDDWLKFYDTEAGSWLSTVTNPDLQEKYRQRVETVKTDWSGTAAVAQLNQTNNWFKTSIAESTQTLQLEIRRNGNGDFGKFRQAGIDLITSSSLPETTKATLLQSWKSDAAIARIEGIAATDPQAALDELNAWLKPQQAPTGASTEVPSVTGAAGLIRKEEGFRTDAYWDVNAFRVGYGSDTVTRADGKVEKVTKDTVITQADADRDLNRRLGEFTVVAAKAVGQETWDALPANVQAGLVSVAYNYGRLPKSVVEAVKTGDANVIASAVGDLPDNPQRRGREADIIRGSSLADLTPDQVDKLRSAVQGDVDAMRTAENKIASDGRVDIVKSGDDLMRNMPGSPGYDPSKPTLTEEWLEQNRENLSPSDRRRYFAALDARDSGDDAIKMDPKELLRLDDLVEEDPKAAIAELRDQFSARTITRGEFDKLTGRAEAIISGQEKRPYIAQIRSYLTQQIRPDADASSAEFATALQQSFAFDDWAAKNKDATREEAQREANAIIAQRQAYRTQALRLTLPIPRFMDAPNRYVIGPDQIVIAKERTRQALASHTISEREAADEAGKIQAWEGLVNQPNQLPLR